MLRAFFHWLAQMAQPAEFAVAFRDGRAHPCRGNAPPAWLADCDDLAREFDLHRGSVDAVRVAGRLQLRFSPGVPRGLHQRFRNVFGTHTVARR